MLSGSITYQRSPSTLSCQTPAVLKRLEAITFLPLYEVTEAGVLLATLLAVSETANITQYPQGAKIKNANPVPFQTTPLHQKSS